jgi:hypothetical protein
MKPIGFFTVATALSAAYVLVLLLTTATTQAEEPTASADSREVVPAEAARLFEYLRSGSYKNFGARESTTHPSAGPHTTIGLPVRVFMNEILDQSLKSGNAQHPQGAAVVKEMFTESGDLRGWAVAIKTDADSDDGKGWYWYEVKSTTDNRRPVAAAKGVSLCSGCHIAGQDFILSQYPLQ